MSNWREASQKRYGKNKEKKTNKEKLERQRGMTQKSLQQQVDDFEKNCVEITDFICYMIERVPTMQVFPDIIPGSLRKLLKQNAPQYGDDMVDILKFFEDNILPSTLHWKHPNFYAYFPGGNGFPNIIGDMLSTAIGGVGFTWTSQPSLTELENIMMDWMQDALNLPKFFSNWHTNGKGGGCIQNTASDAIFSSIIAARHNKLEAEGVYSYDVNWNCIINKHPGPTLTKLVCYVNQEAHSCVIKGAQVALCTIRVLKPNERDAITGGILERQIREDKGKGLLPFYCCASLGTTGGCAFDDLTTIGPVCKAFGLWLHVDAAYGGNSFICPEFRYLKKGLKFANSIEINPYKFLMGSIDCSCMWMKSVKFYKRAYQINSTYMYDEFADIKDGVVANLKENFETRDYVERPLFEQYEIDYRHYGLPTSRRMRSLKLYCLFRHYGIMGLQTYIRNAVKCAKHFETLVKADNRFEITNEVHLALVCFRQKPTKREARSAPPGELSFTDKQNSNLLLRINKSRKIHMVPGTLKGNYVIRFSVNYEHATIEMMNEAWNIIQSNYVTKLDEGFARSTDDIRKFAQLSFLKPVSRQAYEAYLSRRSFTIPMTFGPIIVPADDKHIASLLSLKRQNPIKLALDNEKRALTNSVSTTTEESEETFKGKSLKPIKGMDTKVLGNDPATIPNDDEKNLFKPKNSKDQDTSDQYVISSSSDDDEIPITSRSDLF